MSTRSLRILGRFPAHLGATRAGTRLAEVSGALAAQIDVLSAELAAVRRSHRIGHADVLRDVLLLGALHAIDGDDLGIAALRRDRARALVAALEAVAGGAADARDAAAAALFDLWAIDEPEPRLALFAPAHAEADPPDLAAAAAAFAARLRVELRTPVYVDALRARIVRICALHAGGNASVPTLLDAAANALDLELDRPFNASYKQAMIDAGLAGTLELAVADDLFHSKDLFWHSSFVRDRAPLVRAVPSLVPDKLVRMNATIAASELADQMRLRFDQLAPTLQSLGLTAVRPGDPLDQPTATAIAGALGFTVERFPHAVASIGARTTVAGFATLIGVTPAELLAHVTELGTSGLTADSVLSPATAARAARRWGFQVEQTLPTVQQVLGMEENPMRREEYRKEACEHGHLFSVIRKGFGRETLQVHVTGRADLTVGPMIVNRDEGRGAGWFGSVPDGQTLVFDEDGRVLLEGDDVTERAFSWVGGCFADAGKPSLRDFVLAGGAEDASRRALFAVATPPGSLDREFVFPHAGEPIEMPGIGIGETRMAFFLQQAHLGSRDALLPEPVVRPVTPHPFIAFADSSVFAPVPAADRPPGDTHPDSDYIAPAAADVVLSWLEHEAYALRLIIPRRFALLDGSGTGGGGSGGAAGAPAGGPSLPERVVAALERFRPAGVQIRVDYAEDRWVLGDGTLTGGDAPVDPNLILRGGTVLWTAPAGGT